jgi:hypothetical protein
MPDENSGGIPPSESPNNPAPVNQSPMPSSGAADAQQQIKTTKDLAKDVHWITHATFWSQVCLGIIGIIALWIYHGQLDQMRIATEANTKAVQLAEDSFEINDGNFDRMMTRTIDQTAAQIQSAQAAEDAVKDSQVQMRIDQRAWLRAAGATGTPINDVPYRIIIPLENSGRTPATDVTMYFTGGYFKTGVPTAHVFAGAPQPLGIIAPDSPNSPESAYHFVYGNTQKLHGVSLADHPGEIFVIFGAVTYKDVFRTKHWLTFCYFSIEENAYADCPEHNDIGDGPPPPNALKF